ncbi:hypothetical protein V8G54_007687 [Vigna mungo]|uniref:Beta-galactosidase n=1 Tax=Vigna mungo TaxID=3915 RepID=A0AAQ3P3S4_VIGMU
MAEKNFVSKILMTARKEGQWRTRCFPFAFILTAFIGGAYGGNVTYDGRSLIIDGEHRILFSGSIHYPRSTPQMWPNLIAKAKEGGLDVIQTYVFWNLHEPQQGQYNFRGRRNIVRFVKEIQAQGLYVTLRIGPYIESECTYGGLPIWLHDIPGIVFRSDNEQFKFHMQRFATKIVNVMKSANLYASQGGPIILSQIENEYGNVQGAFHEKGLSYIRWAAQMAVGLQTGVPWVMCKQDNAPDPVYHGGTNFDRIASAFVTTSYYDEAPLDEYAGLIRQPKWGHLKELHAAIKSCSKSLLYGTQTSFSLGSRQNAYVFKSNSTECAAFLENNEDRTVTVQLQNISYQLPPKSISILPDCKNVAFNTAKVRTQNDRSMKSYLRFNSAEKWKVYKEAIPSFDDTSLRANTLLDQISTAKDTSDYMWFNDNSPNNAQSILSAYSQGHVLHTFINGNLVGKPQPHRNASFVMENRLNLIKGMNNVSFLSATVGLPNSGAYLEHKVAGLSRVKVQGQDFTNQAWGYQVGLLGEKLQIYTASGSSKVQWERFQSSTKPLTWYKTTFDAPEGNDPIVLNLESMGKGYTWINGQGIGRYWVSHTPIPPKIYREPTSSARRRNWEPT